MEIFEKLEKSINSLAAINVHDLKYKMQNLEDLFNKYCPFKVGDIVELNKDINPTLEGSWGWYKYRSMLTKWNFGKVVEVDFFNNEFRITVSFEIEQCSWMDADNCIHKSVETKSFCFYANDLQLKTK